MKLLPAHHDETQAKFRLLGPKRDVRAGSTLPGGRGAEPGRGGFYEPERPGMTTPWALGAMPSPRGDASNAGGGPERSAEQV